MTATWVTDIRHFVDEQGRIPPDLPAVRRYLCAIVEEASRLALGKERSLTLRCRRRRVHRRCPGSVHAIIFRDTREISWYCPCCGDGGLIYNWEGSPWDRRSRRGASGSEPPSPVEPAGFTPRATVAWNRIPPDSRVQLLNYFWCGTCRSAVSVELRSGVISRGELVLRGNCTRCGDEIATVVERGRSG